MAPCGGAFCSHLAALTRKNAVLKRRAPLTLLLEVGVPIALVALVLSLKSLPALQDRFYDGAAYVTEETGLLHAQAFGTVPLRLQDAGFMLAVLPASSSAPGAQAAAAAFFSDMSALHPTINFSSVGGGLGMLNERLRAVVVPGFADVARLFADDAALGAYVAAKDYVEGTGVWGAIVFNAAVPGAGFDYSVRMNASDVTSTNTAPVNTLFSRYTSGPINGYVYSKGANTRAPQTMPGFVTLQREVDRWIVGRNVSVSELDEFAVLDLVATALGFVSPNLGFQFGVDMAEISAINATRAALIVADLRLWLRSESFAPQAVDFVPFPTSAYKMSLFYTVVLPNLTLLFIIAFLVPVTRLVRGLVMEKELRLREVMRIMGLSLSAHFLSWVLLYAGIYAVIALLIAAIGTSIFPLSSPFIVFLVFFLFGLSSTTFSILVSVFFSKSRTATVLGGVLFFASYFAYFGISSSESVTRTTLMSGALLSPTALGLAMDVLGQLESNGIGCTRATFGVDGGSSGLWSASSSCAMLLFDFVLYAVLAWYCDAVLPASMREFGVPRPFYFVVLPAFWREDVFGCAPLARGRSAPPSSCASRFWAPTRWLSASDSAGTHNGEQADSSYFEAPDANQLAKESVGRCVQLRQLRKEFDTPDGIMVVVDDVDLTLYEGQIFILLGHNGAGKTTAISMLTGMVEPTRGEATVFGRDISTQLGEVRKELGFCPQHDVLWPELTVREHLQLFGTLKGVPPKDIEAASEEALRMVGLVEKVDALSATLSGGMKRKLSVAIAFLGGSRVVVLDEPTSGMDPYSRRSTWQILQNAREGRVILLTTHFMDEADILGDRCAIMARGQVRCCGSPTFLKGRFGVGYVLTLVRAPGASDSNATLALVRRHVPEASIATDVGAELSMRLPLSSAPAFPALLLELDSSLSTLSVVSYGVSVTSLEDVFLKVAAASSSSVSSFAPTVALESSISRLDSSVAAVVVNPLVGKASPVDAARARSRIDKGGFAAFAGHFVALFSKRVQYSRRDVRSLLCILLIPVALLCTGLGFVLLGLNSAPRDYLLTTSSFNAQQYNYVTRQASSNPRFPSYTPVMAFKSSSSTNATSSDLLAIFDSIAQRSPYNLSVDGGALIIDATVAAAIDANNASGFIIDSERPARDFERMSEFLLSTRGSYAASKYGALLFTRDNTILPLQDPTASLSGTSNASTFAVFHNTSAAHAGPLMMNLLDTALLQVSGGGSGATISVRNHPLPLTAIEQTFALSRQSFVVVQVLCISMSFVPASFVTFVVKEREVGAKHQQLVSGVSVLAYWLSSWLFDALTFLFPWSISIGVVYAFSVGTLTQAAQDHATALTACLLAFGSASCSFVYMLSHAFGSHSSAQVVVIMLMILSFAGAIVVYVLAQVSSSCTLVPYIAPVLRLLPHFALTNALQNLAQIATLPTTQFACDAANGGAGPASSYQPYTTAFAWGVTGSGLTFLCVESVVYLFLAIAIDIALRDPRVRRRIDGDPAPVSSGASLLAVEDEDVVAEARRVAALVSPGAPPVADDVVLLSSLRKVYAGGKVAVRSLSFGLPLGEVFGFLGINGAGKTSALKMLSGDVLPSSGSAQLAGFDIVSQQLQVRRLLGYCPQFDALLDLLSVREHLELYARIKGVPEPEVRAVVEKQLSEFDLKQYSTKLAGTLSGGNKRKLSVAIALIGDPPIVFLDEPSTGVDPVARRFLWGVISRVANEQRGCTIILTTHSMEEVEALCTRIGIMVGGRLRCLGTAQHLRNRHGSGFVSTLQLAPPTLLSIDAVVVAVRSGRTIVDSIPQDSLADVCNQLGHAQRATLVSSTGSGWALHAALVATGAVGVRDFALWWAEEDAVERLLSSLSTSFPGMSLVERQGITLKVGIPRLELSLAHMFELLEGTRRERGVASYILGQTSLEQVFNTFASQQDEEIYAARGVAASGRSTSFAQPAPAVRAGALAVNSDGPGAGGGVSEWRSGSKKALQAKK